MPPLSGIQDPVVRRALQALSDGWSVRNGAAGDGKQRFLTEADIKDMASVVVYAGLRNIAAGNAVTGGGGLPGGWPTVGDMVAALEGAVLKSPLWSKLGEKIEFITKDNSTQLQRIASLETGIYSEQIQRTAKDSVLLQNITTLTGRVGTVEGAIDSEKTVRLSADTALVSAINTMWAAAGTTNALVQTGSAITANWTGTQANMWSQIQTEVFTSGGQTIRQALASESQLRANADGTLSAHYTVKIDQNGWVSGFGLMSTSAANQAATSAFYVRADRFAVGTPAYNGNASGTTPPSESVPFIVQTTPTVVGGHTIPAGVYMKAAFIQDLSVDTFKLAGNAITLTVSGFPSDVTGNGTYQQTGFISLPLVAGNGVLLTFFTRIGFLVVNGTKQWGFKVKRRMFPLADWTVLRDYGTSYAVQDYILFSLSDTIPSDGTWQYAVDWYGQDANLYLGNTEIFAIGIKR